MPKRKAVFLDRDGTLVKSIERPNFEKGITAPFHFSELEFFPDLDKAMTIMGWLGFLRIIITNQPDAAYGHVSEEEWTKIHTAILGRVQPDDCFMCRHRRDESCPMRKPSPLMIFTAACKWNVNLAKSFMIGDTEYDMGAGKAAGCKTILLDRKYNADVVADFRARDLLEAAQVIERYS